MAIDVAFPSPVLFFQSTLDGAKLDGDCVTDPNTVTEFPKILWLLQTSVQDLKITNLCKY